MFNTQTQIKETGNRSMMKGDKNTEIHSIPSLSLFSHPPRSPIMTTFLATVHDTNACGFKFDCGSRNK